MLRKIIKIVAIKSHLLTPKCTKFYFGWGSLQRYLRPCSQILGGPTSKEKEGRGEGKTGEGREAYDREKGEKKGDETPLN